VIDTSTDSVLPPPEPGSAAHAPTGVDTGAPAVVVPGPWAQVVGTVLVTIAGLIVLFVVGASLWPVERYQAAPGTAEEVVPRLSVADEAITFEPEESLFFVTASGSELTGLQAIVGWLDPVVDVLTCEQRFGECDPELQRQLGLGAMATSKQIAEYVAFTLAGYDAELVPGPAQVGSFSPDTCPDDAPPRRACEVLEVGDTILSIDGTPTPLLDDLSAILRTRSPGEVVTLRIRPARGGDERDVEVELMAAPDEPERTIIGFIPRDTRTVEVPYEVEIDTDRIGGPSAGLAFTLALIDVLTPGELTGGVRVVATGTIDDNGEVGAIGALPQKADAVRRAGATVFLVPADQDPAELDRARAVAGPGVEVIPVATVEEALQVLEDLGGDPIEPVRPSA
jgi:PDZ domain-containing protein